ncbi:MAG: toll/interleukin-1 receptor domain-containing protein [Chloroflexota bacterium]
MSEADEKQALIAQMGSHDNKTALQAVKTLRERGWLTDGTLRGADLSQADLWGADLSQADLSRADFRKANLSGAWLIRADLWDADLSGADLWDADLSRADFRKANLRQAYLSQAYLSQANLSQADLRGADLSGADLSQTNLIRTNFGEAFLMGTNFEQARCYSTLFADVDLSTVKGLETIEHRGPSSIGIDTLYRSQGKLPEIFLLGCGVPDTLIAFQKSLIGSAIELYSCFISYNHTDKIFARRVYDTLQGQGIRCWLDEKQLNPGDDIYEGIEHGIRYWDKVLLCASQHSLTSWWVDNELDTLFEKERLLMKDRGEKILALIPLDLDGYLFSDDFNSGKKRQVQSRIAADFKGWEHDNAIFEREIERVINALKLGGDKELPPKSLL